MTTISEYRQYRKELDLIVGKGKRLTKTLINQIGFSDGLSEKVLVQRKNLLGEYLSLGVGLIADEAAELAAEFYTIQRAREVSGIFNSVVEIPDVEKRMERTVRSSARHLFGDVVSVEAFQRELQGKTSQYIRETASQTIAANALKDSFETRFARVPAGFETCKFCQMLASRGAVYVSSKTAGEFNHYHANCKCLIVPHFVSVESLYSADGFNDGQLRARAQELVSEAWLHEAEVTADLMAAVEKVGSKLAGLEFKIKTESSLIRKLKADGLDTKMKDVLRFTSLSDEKDMVNAYKSIMADLESKGYNVSAVKNYWLDAKSAYKGVNTNLVNPSGYEFELQFHSPHNLEVKERMHKLYEKERVLDLKENAQEIAQIRLEMDGIAKDYIRPSDINLISNIVRVGK